MEQLGDILKKDVARRLRKQAHDLFMLAKALDPPSLEPVDKPPKPPKGYDPNTVDWMREMEEAEGADIS